MQDLGGGSVFNSFESEKIVFRPIAVLISLNASSMNENRFCEYSLSVSQSILFWRSARLRPRRGHFSISLSSYIFIPAVI